MAKSFWGFFFGVPASHLPCNTNTNGECGEWRSSSFRMTDIAWADVWAGALSWLQVSSVCFLNWKNSWKDTNFLTTRTLYARQMIGWKTKNSNSFTTESELWRNAGPSAFQLQETMFKVTKCDVRISYMQLTVSGYQLFWTPLVYSE